MYVRTIDQYYFVGDEGVLVDVQRRRRGRYYLCGTLNESWAFFMGTEHHRTSCVMDISEDGEVTTQHSVYELGTMSQDYQEFLNATRNGVQAIANWNLYGSKEFGYFLTADMYPQRKALGISKIVSQEGNFLVIQRLLKIPSGEVIWADPEKVFVCWNSISTHALKEIQTRSKVADIPYDDFKKFCASKCKPIL